MPGWPETVRRVGDFLTAARAEARLEEFRGGTSTASAAARAIGCRPDQIVKTLLFECDGLPAAVLVPGDRRADARKIAAALGASRARVAGRERVEALTGFSPGAVAPFPLQGIEHVLVDRTLLAKEEVWVGAGSPRHMARLRPAELVRLARARPIDAVEQAPAGQGPSGGPPG